MVQGNVIIQIGNWAVTDEGMFTVTGVDYPIHKDRLGEARPDDEQNKYDWMLQVAEKMWMSELDLYQFNSLFLFAVEYFNVPKLDLLATLKEQRAEFDADRTSRKKQQSAMQK